MGAAANRYSRALLDVLYSKTADAPKTAEAGLQQLERFSVLLKEQPDARRIFENPTIAGDRRKKLLNDITKTMDFEKRVANFINILIEKNRLNILDEIIAAYQRLLDERMGIVRAKVTAAQPLDAAQQKDLSTRLEKLTGKQVRMEVAVDPSLIGGMVAQVGGTIYDGSIRQQLQDFKHRLIEG